MGNENASGIRLHAPFPAACPAQGVRKNPLLWIHGPRQKESSGSGPLSSGSFEAFVGALPCAQKRSSLPLLRITASIDQTAGGTYTRTAMEKKMCLINGFLFRLFTVKAVAWKTMGFTEKKLEIVVKTVASSFTHRHVKEHCSEKSLFPTALLVAMSGKDG